MNVRRGLKGYAEGSRVRGNDKQFKTLVLVGFQGYRRLQKPFRRIDLG